MERSAFRHYTLSTMLLLAAAAACSQHSSSSILPSANEPPASEPMSRSHQIRHVILMIQENRSFDNLFATFPGADGATKGLMKTRHGDVYVTLKKSPLEFDSLGHAHQAFKKEYDNGNMDGFNLDDRAIAKGVQVPAKKYPYRYVDPEQILPYWFIASHYVLADHMFTTQGSSSFTSHQDFIAGGTPVDGDNVIDFPDPATWGCDGAPGTKTNLITPKGKYRYAKGPFPCFEYATLRDLLDARAVPWLYFTHLDKHGVYWNAFEAIKAVRYGAEWQQNIIMPQTKIFDYIANHKLPAMSWLIPDAFDSDHPSSNRKDLGPSWVASVINAVGESRYWTSTVVIVVWDEWGGEYDHVPPPQLDGQGLGMRIPMLIVSAYDRKTDGHEGFISHTQYEDGSILKFIEHNWKLGSLGTSDVRANSISDCFDFSKPARPFIAVPSSYPISYFKNMKPSDEPIDEY